MVLVFSRAYFCIDAWKWVRRVHPKLPHDVVILERPL